MTEKEYCRLTATVHVRSAIHHLREALGYMETDSSIDDDVNAAFKKLTDIEKRLTKKRFIR